jgi:sulfur relay (sulfurtransferase) complex TusBCD TusD component (DsrE family)
MAGQGPRLLVCSAAAARRLDATAAEISGGAFQEAGLAQLWDLASRSDRVVTF